MATRSLAVIGIDDGLFLGKSAGFDGTIKRRPSDFIVDEIDTAGKLVEISNFALPSSSNKPAVPARPAPNPPSTASAEEPANSSSDCNPHRQGGGEGGAAVVAAAPGAGVGDSAGDGEECPGTCWAERLRRAAGGGAVERLAELDAAARAGTMLTAFSCFASGTGDACAAGAGVVAGDGAGANAVAVTGAGSGSGAGSGRVSAGASSACGPGAGSGSSSASGAGAGAGIAAGAASRGGDNSISIFTPERGEANASKKRGIEVVGDNNAIRGGGGEKSAVGTTTTINRLDTALADEKKNAAQEETRDNNNSSSICNGGKSKGGRGAGGILARTGSNEGLANGGAGLAVRIPAGCGPDKEARARVHRAVQETFPFVKTTTERDPDGSVTVVCSQAKPLPALRGLLKEAELEALQRMVNRGPGFDGAQEGVTLSSDQDRSHRTLVHRAIAAAFPYLQTKTCSGSSPRDQKNVQRVTVLWGKRRGGGKRKRTEVSEGRSSGGDTNKAAGAAGRGRGRDSRCHAGGAAGGAADLIRFALRKEGREHNHVVAALSKVLRVPYSAFSFGGVKDKMAVTTQACVVQWVPPAKLIDINGSVPGVSIGNLSFGDRPLSLGDLSGNRFSTVVRGVNVSRDVLHACVEEASTGGFVNFFGTQRIGSPSAAARGEPLSHEIGRDILRGDWEAAVRKILRPRAGDPPFLHSALSDLQEGKATPKKCAARVKGHNRLANERLVLQGLVRYGDSAFKAAIQCVPYGSRTMWVHAYQSQVWNSLVSTRLRLFGPRAVPGDLVLPSDAPGERFMPSPGFNDYAAGETGGVSMRGRGVGSSEALPGRVGGEDLEENAGDSKSRGMSNCGASKKKKEVVTVLTVAVMEAFVSEGVTPEELMRRVVLPLPGTAVDYPTNEIGEMYKKRLEEDGVYPTMWREPASEAVSPTDVAVFDATTIPLAPLAASNAPGNDPTQGKPALVPKGGYRRVLCVPGDLKWTEASPWTDDKKQSRIAVDGMQGSTTTTVGGDGDSGDSGGAEVAFTGTVDCEEGKGIVAGVGGGGRGRNVEDVCLSFTLPPGSFATMLLREVMKTNGDLSWGGERGEGAAQDDDGVIA